MKRIIDLLRSVILRPFTTEIVYTMLLWLAIMGYLIFYQLWIGAYYYCLYLALFSYFFSVVFSLIINANKYIALILKPLVLLVIIFLLLINMFCVRNFATHLSADIVEIISNTNIEEAYEFILVYINPLQIVSIFIVLLLVFFILYKAKWQLHGKIIFVPICLFILSVLSICHNINMFKSEFKSEDLWHFSYEEIVDLRHHATNPHVIEIDSIHPSNIVIIIGESFTKRQSSLYGYQKSTNPLLSELVESGNMVVFKDVTSPQTYTNGSFKYILNTHVLSDSSDKKWYDYTNIIEVFKTAGYKTLWFSNLRENGVYDNLTTRIAELCDYRFFNDAKKQNLTVF